MKKTDMKMRHEFGEISSCIPQEIERAERPKPLAFEQLRARLAELTKREGRLPTAEESGELMAAFEAAARDDLWTLRADREQTEAFPSADFEALRLLIKEKRLTARAHEDVGIFLDEADETRAAACQTIDNLLRLRATIDATEAQAERAKGGAVDAKKQSARRDWIKKEMEYWHYAGSS
jgi:hypothetical protein